MLVCLFVPYAFLSHLVRRAMCNIEFKSVRLYFNRSSYYFMLTLLNSVAVLLAHVVSPRASFVCGASRSFGNVLYSSCEDEHRYSVASASFQSTIRGQT